VAFVVPPGEGANVPGPMGGPLEWKARGATTAGRLTAVENVIGPGLGPPLHRHPDEDEAYYVLRGALRYRFGDEVVPAPEGSFVFIPRGTPHCFQNVGRGPATLLVLFTPAGMEPFFDGAAELGSGPIAPEVMRELAAAAGMEVLGPPLATSHPTN
jgi:quercetin dioxygenase-like cupin family protein